MPDDKRVTCYQVDSGNTLVPESETCGTCRRCTDRKRKRDERAKTTSEGPAEPSKVPHAAPDREPPRSTNAAAGAAGPSSHSPREETRHTDPSKKGDAGGYARTVNFELADTAEEGSEYELDPEIAAIMERAQNLPPMASFVVGGLCARMLGNLAKLDAMGKGVPLLCPTNPEHTDNVTMFMGWFQGVASYTVAMFWPKGDKGRGHISKWTPPVMLGVTLGGSEVTVHLVAKQLAAEQNPDAPREPPPAAEAGDDYEGGSPKPRGLVKTGWAE